MLDFTTMRGYTQDRKSRLNEMKEGALIDTLRMSLFVRSPMEFGKSATGTFLKQIYLSA